MAEAFSTPAPVPAPLPARRPRRLLRRWGVGLTILLGLLILAVVAGGLWFRSRMEASLPQLAGERAIAGLAAAVEVERDALGVPTVRAASREDAARALGFLHAQDRFFQMDLLRRSAAGELAEMVGSAVVESDREIRLHRFRHVAGRVVAQATPEDRAFLQAYTEGVNVGLSALGGKPFEYILLGVEPAPWRPEDSILAVFAMFIDLQDEDGSNESELGFLHDTLPREMYDFLSLPGTEWDAPLVGEPFAVPPVPGPEVFDLRKAGAARRLPKAARRVAPYAEPAWNEAVLGSNNWAVAGTHTAHGGALLANDMHLGIRVPNTWYRASIVRPDRAGGTLRLTGVTLPGTPSMVVGSNGHVAWGFTNTYGDWSDVILLEVDPRQPGTYRTPAGLKAFRTVTETIRVKGDGPVSLEVKETIWGPVIEPDHRGRPRAFAWTAHHPAAVNLGIQGMEAARTVDEAMAVANRSGIPAQNFVVADATGRIGWTVMGRIPRRVGFSGRIPTSWADGSHRWDGWLAPEEVPRVVDPPSGRIWTANARVVAGEALAKLGDGGYDLGARSRQIRDGLFALGKATPRDMLAVQLDDRALFLERWRKLLLDTLTPEAVAADPRRSELRRLVETTWTGRASVDSVAYRMVRSFRLNLAGQVFTSLTGQWDTPQEERFGPTRQFEGWLWRLVTERPVHLLDSKFRSWDEQLLSAVDETVDFFAERGKLADRTWGERNTTSFAHPLSAAVPFLGRWLDVPARALPGDENMPRFQGPSDGASERMVVSPGAEESGFFHMPVGQSGHPLSPYYLAGHEAWERGEPAPFLPGPAEHRLRLVPGG
ncbi:MAG TPA: penicillin acylase family protein [Thermoanaerobaculia bacterium]|nr:penicillin acylase family protein [Thermoanaerobaculia bacterium]